MKFDEVLKQLEPSMAVPMYSKALLIDFMRKAYDEGFKDCAKSRLNVTTISDCPIKNEWHDLRKDPDDLPEDTYDVLDQAGYKVHYNFFQNVWVNEKDEIDEHVIAWCEIPTFDKE